MRRPLRSRSPARAANCASPHSGAGADGSYIRRALPPPKITLTSSTTAYDPPLFPPVGSLGTAIFYLQIHPANAVTFGDTIGTGFGIESVHLAPKKAYTVRYSTGDGSLWLSFGACYTVAKKVTNGGSIPNVGTRLEGQKVYPTSYNVIEIFSGKQTTGAC